MLVVVMDLKVLLVIIAGASLGTPQMISLTQDRELTCPGEEVHFNCTTDGQVGRIQWIAEPYITATEALSVIFNSDSNLFDITPIGNVSIQLVSNDPFITTLTMNGTTATFSTNVTCLTVEQSPAISQVQYFTNDRPVEPVTIMDITIIGYDSSGFHFMVTFTSSSSPGVVQYVMCIGANCNYIVTTSQTITASGRCPNPNSCNFSICAVNRCGRESGFEIQSVTGTILPAEGLKLWEADDDSNWFSTRVVGAFTLSATPNISRYMVNCTDNACNGVVLNKTQNFFSMDVGSSCTGATYNLSIIAFIGDGSSRAVTASVKVKEKLGYCLVTSLFTVIIFGLLLSSIGLLAYIIYLKKCTGKVGDGSDKKSRDKQERQDNDTKLNLVNNNDRDQCDAIV